MKKISKTAFTIKRNKKNKTGYKIIVLLFLQDYFEI